MSYFYPHLKLPGNYSTRDGTIDFYSRIKTLINDNMILLDLGAGRAAWNVDDEVSYRKNIRLLKGYVKEVIAVDVDEVVLGNLASDKQIIIKDGIIPVEDNSIDMVICDYVFEHIDDPENFIKEISRVLKSDGWVCARTPHKFNYVSLLSRVIRSSYHVKVLKWVQPMRQEIDIFPTKYKLNTFSAINFLFSEYENFSFLYRSDPAYYFGSRTMYFFLKHFDNLMPAFFSANIFVFLRKK